MNYICPYCQYMLSVDNNYYYCHNKICRISYSFYPEHTEEFMWENKFVDISIRKNVYYILLNNVDITEMIKEFLTIEELKLQYKNQQKAIEIINKIDKLCSMKAFW